MNHSRIHGITALTLMALPCVYIPLGIGPEIIKSVLAGVAILIGCPLGILWLIDQSNQPQPKPLYRILGKVMKIMIGSLALLFGSAIILWVLWNTFIHREPQFQGDGGTASIALRVMACVMFVLVGWSLLRRPHAASDYDMEHDDDEEDEDSAESSTQPPPRDLPGAHPSSACDPDDGSHAGGGTAAPGPRDL